MRRQQRAPVHVHVHVHACALNCLRTCTCTCRDACLDICIYMCTHPAALEESRERGAHGELLTPPQREAAEVLSVGEVLEHLSRGGRQVGLDEYNISMAVCY